MMFISDVSDIATSTVRSLTLIYIYLKWFRWNDSSTIAVAAGHRAPVTSTKPGPTGNAYCSFFLHVTPAVRPFISFTAVCSIQNRTEKKMNRLDPSAKIMMVSFVTCRFINILTNLTRLICLWITSSIVFCILYGPIYSTLYSSVNMIRKVQREANEMQCTHNSLWREFRCQMSQLNSNKVTGTCTGRKFQPRMFLHNAEKLLSESKINVRRCGKSFCSSSMNFVFALTMAFNRDAS